MRERWFGVSSRLAVLLLPLGLLNCASGADLSPKPVVACSPQNPAVCSQVANIPLCADKAPTGCRCFEQKCLYRLNLAASSRCRCIKDDVQICALPSGEDGIQSCIEDTSVGGAPATKWDTCSAFP
jgi:hypothetical protein